MLAVRTTTRIDACQRIWERAIAPETVFDLWALRECFHRHFACPPLFLTVEESGHSALLPLSVGSEASSAVYFPGERWRGRTWLERNRLAASDGPSLDRLIQAAPDILDLRYLTFSSGPRIALEEDETSYLFFPAHYDFCFDRYLASLPAKRFKSADADLDALKAAVTYRYDAASDYARLIEMNVTTFGADSYFHEPRFRAAFDDVVSMLRGKGWLRVTSALIDGRPAAIDVGCIYRGTHTLLAGATDSEFRGIAKLINLHHMEQACRQRLASVDFMAGDFPWKRHFKLSPHRQYQLVTKRNARVGT
ncbi:GNAT family N-acetyltransferase [Ancylobacter sp.]|uniref:GNAT family N-acetyltransferase n=1 Tax=Ancylobacter sp. TaxID=1872567 RepID=UPI003D11B6BB